MVSKVNDDFIKKLKDIYGDRFLYHEVEIQKFNGVDQKNHKILVSRNDHFYLTCKEHKLKFQESFENAFQSKGCQECELENNFIEAKSKNSDDADEVIQHLKDIKKTGEKTYKKVEEIDKNINVLLNVEKIKASCKKEKVEDCINKIISLIEKQYRFKNIKSFDKLVKKWFDF